MRAHTLVVVKSTGACGQVRAAHEERRPLLRSRPTTNRWTQHAEPFVPSKRPLPQLIRCRSLVAVIFAK